MSSVSAGGFHSVFVLACGEVWCVGTANVGQLGFWYMYAAVSLADGQEIERDREIQTDRDSEIQTQADTDTDTDIEAERGWQGSGRERIQRLATCGGVPCASMRLASQFTKRRKASSQHTNKRQRFRG